VRWTSLQYVHREFLTNHLVKEFWKLVHVCQSYYQTSCGLLFWNTVYLRLVLAPWLLDTSLPMISAILCIAITVNMYSNKQQWSKSHLRMCLAIVARSTILPELGRTTGSRIRSPMIGSRKSSGTFANASSSACCSQPVAWRQAQHCWHP